MGRFDAAQSSLSLVHGQSLLDGALRLQLNASFTQATPPTEAELGYHQALGQSAFHGRTDDGLLLGQSAVPPGDPIYRATPNVRSATLTPLFGPGSSPVTSVAPGADGTGGLAAFTGRAGVPNLDFFNAPAGFVASPNSLQYPYGRRQKRSTYYLSAVYDAFPWLQVGVAGTYVHTVVNRGYDVLTADLALAAGSPLNPFHQDYSEAQLDFSSAVVGLLFRAPSGWRASLDTQYAHNLVNYRGIAGADADRWQQLVDEGAYNPLRDTQTHDRRRGSSHQ